MAKTDLSHLKVVIIGGGTGIFPVITALRNLKVQLSTLVAVSDSGGSTGRIRDEFGFAPVGDLRQSLAALATASEESQHWIRKLLLYRFDKGQGLKGHNLGNLILTALQDMTGSTSKALATAGQIFRLNGQVIPVTEGVVQLKIHYADGQTIIGEHILDHDSAPKQAISKVTLEPKSPLNPLAAQALAEADYIIIGPGDFYASLLAALAPTGVKKAFANITAPILYISNLMTRATQTHDMALGDHVKKLEQTLDKPITTILVNNDSIPQTALQLYATENEYPVKNDMITDPRIIQAPLLRDQMHQHHQYDTAHRSHLRHSSQKLQQVFARLWE